LLQLGSLRNDLAEGEGKLERGLGFATCQTSLRTKKQQKPTSRTKRISTTNFFLWREVLVSFFPVWHLLSLVYKREGGATLGVFKRLDWPSRTLILQRMEGGSGKDRRSYPYLYHHNDGGWRDPLSSNRQWTTFSSLPYIASPTNIFLCRERYHERLE